MRVGRRRIALVVALIALTACSHVKMTEHVAITEKVTAWRSISCEVYAAPDLGADAGSLSTFQEDLESRVKRSTTDVELVEYQKNRLLGRFTVETTSGGSNAGQYDFSFDSATEVAIKRASVWIVKWLDAHD